jgi:hypothetical protein
MEQKQRVTLRFGDADELQYVADLPRTGDFVRHQDELWVVARVERDSLGALVICEHEPNRSPHAVGRAIPAAPFSPVAVSDR